MRRKTNESGTATVPPHPQACRRPCPADKRAGRRVGRVRGQRGGSQGCRGGRPQERAGRPPRSGLAAGTAPAKTAQRPPWWPVKVGSCGQTPETLAVRCTHQRCTCTGCRPLHTTVHSPRKEPGTVRVGGSRSRGGWRRRRWMRGSKGGGRAGGWRSNGCNAPSDAWWSGWQPCNAPPHAGVRRAGPRDSWAPAAGSALLWGEDATANRHTRLRPTDARGRVQAVSRRKRAARRGKGEALWWWLEGWWQRRRPLGHTRRSSR